jgi:hypothetical protein
MSAVVDQYGIKDRLDDVAGEIATGQEITDEWNRMSIEEKRVYEKRLIWKLDWKIIPWLTFLYLLSFLDRTNIGNAKVQGV